MILSAIAAMARNRVIGINNQLPWNLPEDMRYFKQKTKGKIIIMGRKTFESFGGNPLPDRFHIVITRQKDFVFFHPQVAVVSGFSSALALAREKIPEYSEEVFIIGGGEIYQQSLELLNRIYLTIIEQDYAGDAKFPEFDLEKFKLKSTEQRTGFSFNLFERG